MRFASVVSVLLVRKLSPNAPNRSRSAIQIAKSAAYSPNRLRGIVRGNFSHGAGDEADVIFIHGFVDAEQNAALEDCFGLGAFYFRVIHRRQTEFFDGPAAGEERI